MHDDIPGWSVPLHRSLSEPILMGGIPRSLAITLGTLRMENSATYVVAGLGNLSMQVNTGAASINVTGGSHKINLPLTFASNTNINVAGGATLTIGNPTTINAGTTFRLTLPAPDAEAGRDTARISRAPG